MIEIPYSGSLGKSELETEVAKKYPVLAGKLKLLTRDGEQLVVIDTVEISSAELKALIENIAVKKSLPETVDFSPEEGWAPSAEDIDLLRRADLVEGAKKSMAFAMELMSEVNAIVDKRKDDILGSLANIEGMVEKLNTEIVNMKAEQARERQKMVELIGGVKGEVLYYSKVFDLFKSGIQDGIKKADSEKKQG